MFDEAIGAELPHLTADISFFTVAARDAIEGLWRRRAAEPSPPIVAADTAPAATQPAVAEVALPRPVMTSVVIPTYNRATLLLEAVESVLAQTEHDFEVLVVDDGSDDDTEARLRRVNDPRVSYIRIAHQGVSAARNMGITLARGRYIAFLDSDDLWKPGKLAAERVFFERHPEVGIVFSDLEKWDGDEFVASFMRTTDVFSRWLIDAGRNQTLLLLPRTMRWCLLQEVPIKVPSLTIRRDLLVDAGGFDASWSSSEDWELLLRLAARTTFGYIDQPLAVIRVSPDSLHRLDQERGDTSMIDLLARQRECATDAATRAAARRGLAVRSKHLGWYYADSGRRLASAATYARGFLKTGDLELLARVVRALGPTETSR